jgi:hypothetical protein
MPSEIWTATRCLLERKSTSSRYPEEAQGLLEHGSTNVQQDQNV